MSDCSSKYREYPQPAPASPAPRRHWGVLIASLVIAVAGIAIGGYGLFIGSRQGETQDALETALTDVQADLAAAQAELDAANASLSTARAELTTANDSLAQKQAELDTASVSLSTTQSELTRHKTALQQMSALIVRDEIISELTAAMKIQPFSVSLEPDSGDIIISFGSLFFWSDSIELSATGKELLSSFVPAYLEVLLRPKYKGFLNAIYIEGHMDAAQYTTLSKERAQVVLRYITSMYQGDSATLSRLEQLLVADGKGSSDPVYYSFGGQKTIDEDASRRIEFRFTLTGTDSLPEINKLLNGQ